MSSEPPSQPPSQPPIDWRDTIEREPPGWRVLPFAIVAVILIFFVLIPWISMRCM